MNGERTRLLEQAVLAFEQGDYIRAAEALATSGDAVDKENAVICRRIANGIIPGHMVDMQRHLLKEHLDTAKVFGW
jgi:hypothetical protein